MVYIVFPEIIEKNIAFLILNLHSLLLINDIATSYYQKGQILYKYEKSYEIMQEFFFLL